MQGEQPPAGGPDPRHQQPNPYLQPGYQQPGPYGAGQQPQGDWNSPGAPPGGGPGRRTQAIAITASAVVVVAAAVTGAVLLGGDSDDGAAPGPTASSASPSTSGNPRTDTGVQPTVAGWEAVVNPDLGVAFDVPPEWAPKSPDWVSYVAEADDPDEKPLVAMKAPAVLQEKWCSTDEDRDGTLDHTELASVGTRGNNGARSTEEIARADSAAWVYGLYTQPDHKKVGTEAVRSFTTASGIKGTVTTSRSSGAPKRDKCDTDGKATTFAFKNAAGDFVSWSFVGATGVRAEVPEATVSGILDTVRIVEPAS
ncbi:hypothetical protein ACIQAC_33585 [Streptomyces sp. NPDC088387]|uniref:hypothetical protein n=1 Tax=Streptomyces sp. NPDC088387 TaxID=3365859 RepID=UPI003806FE6A